MKENGLLDRVERLLGIVVVAALVFGFAKAYVTPVHAQINSPSVGSDQLPPNEAPCLTFNINQTTGTNEQSIATTPGYLSWTLLSTATADGSVFVTLKDSGTITTAQPDLMRLYHGSTSQPTKVTFQPPMIFVRGLTAAQSVATSWVTFCYRTYLGSTP